MKHLLCFALLLLPAVAAPDDKPADDPHVVKPGHAPTPYTAEEIRKAHAVGRVDVMKNETVAQTITITRKILKSDENGVEAEMTVSKQDGTALSSKTMSNTWKELQSHASFPENATKITEETIEVPAGKFDCKVYTVTEKVKTTRYYFAKTSFVGPPVKMVVEVAGKAVSTLTLIEHKDPPADAPKGS